MSPRRSYARRAVAGIQARMGSSRLPGKSLADVAGLPLIRRVYDRARAARSLDAVVVLTSVEAADDALASYCEASDIPVRRGPEQDVFARYTQLMDEFDPRYVLRITGDCPFVSPAHIDAQVAALEAHDADFAPAGAAEHIFPGQGAISARALRLAESSTDPEDREHVGSFYLARRRAEFRTVTMQTASFAGSEGLRLCVDEAADLEQARAVYAALEPDFGALVPVEQVVRFLVAARAAHGLGPSVLHSDANRRVRALEQSVGATVVGEWRRDA